MELPPSFTRKTLAEFCGISPKRIDDHIRQDTLGLKSAVEKIPGVGVRIKGPKARRFIEVMHAKLPQQPQPR